MWPKSATTITFGSMCTVQAETYISLRVGVLPRSPLLYLLCSIALIFSMDRIQYKQLWPRYIADMRVT